MNEAEREAIVTAVAGSAGSVRERAAMYAAGAGVVLDVRGWNRGRTEDAETGAVCLFGAVAVASSADGSAYGLPAHDDGTGREAVVLLGRTLSVLTAAELGAAGVSWENRAPGPMWNDELATSADDVKAMLARAGAAVIGR